MVRKYDSYNILIGSVPVVLSAPHNAEHIRNNKLKHGEVNTRSNCSKNI
ncbi:MAG: hypothetical protein RSE00_01790 [Clostridia bacterium]